MSLHSFRAGLEARIAKDKAVRPFVCHGRPYRCQAFLVGINPASRVPFWSFRDDDKGFDKGRWFEQYRKERAPRLPPVSSTRRRIEWLVNAASPVALLETNLFSVATPSAADLRIEDKQTCAFEYLLSEIMPSVLLLHGKAVRRYFENRYNCSLTPCFSTVAINGRIFITAAVPHLFNASQVRAKELGATIRSLCPTG